MSDASIRKVLDLLEDSDFSECFALPRERVNCLVHALISLHEKVNFFNTIHYNL